MLRDCCGMILEARSDGVMSVVMSHSRAWMKPRLPRNMETRENIGIWSAKGATGYISLGGLRDQLLQVAPTARGAQANLDI